MSQGKRFPVQQAIGRPGPSQVTDNPLVSSLLQSMMQGAAGPMMDPSALQGAPPWVPMLFNQIQAMETKIEVLQFTLLRRGLITNAELKEAMLEISCATAEQFDQQVNMLAQKLPPAVPSDPRRPPQP